MQAPWVQQLLHRLADWLPLRTHDSHVTATGKVRISVPPPALHPWHHSEFNLKSWLSSGWIDSGSSASDNPHRLLSGRKITPLAEIRQEFISALHDVPGHESAELQQDIEDSRSLRELWHWRTDVFELVALHHNQDIAQTRLALLNRHFPSQANRHTRPAASAAMHSPWRTP